MNTLILASASPRRKDLLEKAGYNFETIVSNVDEESLAVNVTDATELAMLLAEAKAKDVADNHPDRIVLGADTLVQADNEIIGKPKDAADAERITRLLFSAPHKVITAIAILQLRQNLRIVESDTTIVYPRMLNEKQIADHLASGTWSDKAGAYAIQENGDEFVERIEGSLTNVMGLPMERVERILKKVLSC